MLDAQLLAPLTTRGLRREEYDRLVALGAFEDERIELLEGELVTMGPNNPEYASAVQVLGEILVPPLVGRATIRIQLPIIAARESEPEPDVAIVPLGEYRQAHPDRAHCVIEVVHSSLSKDRNIKAPLYAASGFREYWLVHVPSVSSKSFAIPAPSNRRAASATRSDSRSRSRRFRTCRSKSQNFSRRSTLSLLWPTTLVAMRHDHRTTPVQSARTCDHTGEIQNGRRALASDRQPSKSQVRRHTSAPHVLAPRDARVAVPLRSALLRTHTLIIHHIFARYHR